MKPLTIRKKLCERAGGTWIPSESGRGGQCKGGRCEKCGLVPDWRGLHPHEQPFRSHGGKLSMKSKMLCGHCHAGPDGHRTEGIEHSKPVDRTPLLAGMRRGFTPYPKEMQTGVKRK